MTLKQWLLDTGERVLTTFIEVFLAVLVTSLLASTTAAPPGGGVPLVDVSILGIAAAAAIAAAANVLLNALVGFDRLYQIWWQDLMFRVTKASVLAGLVVITADQFNVWDVNGWQTVWIAVITAALTVIKGYLAKLAVKRTVTPASLLTTSTYKEAAVPTPLPPPAAA